MNQSDPIDTLARTIWGESRNQGREGMECVANVVMNRVSRAAWWGNDVCSVSLHPYQFSCWNENDPNRPLVESVGGDDPQFTLALLIAQNAINGILKDWTGGSTYYFAGDNVPDWAQGKTPTFVYGAHKFFNLPATT